MIGDLCNIVFSLTVGFTLNISSFSDKFSSPLRPSLPFPLPLSPVSRADSESREGLLYWLWENTLLPNKTSPLVPALQEQKEVSTDWKSQEAENVLGANSNVCLFLLASINVYYAVGCSGFPLWILSVGLVLSTQLIWCWNSSSHAGRKKIPVYHPIQSWH